MYYFLLTIKILSHKEIKYMSASFENYTFNGQTKEGLIRCNGEFLLITMDKSRQNITVGNSLEEAKEKLKELNKEYMLKDLKFN